MRAKVKKQFQNPVVLPLLVVGALLVVLWSAGTVGANSPGGPAMPESVPTMLNYQGVVEVSDVPYDGTGYFKFAIVNAATGDGTTNYWANDGTASGEPAAPVSLTVSEGLFNVLLGDTSIVGMSQAIDPSVFGSDVTYLRVWFSQTGTPGTFDGLEPNQRIASVAYALHAEYAENSPAGATGATGPSGPYGPTGPQGPSGPTGPTDLCGYSQSCTGSGLALSTSSSTANAFSGTLTSASATGAGVYGENVNTGSGYGVYGDGYYGVYGYGDHHGVHGRVTGNNDYGVYGQNTAASGAGVFGTGYVGVQGESSSYGVYGSGDQYAVYGFVTGAGDIGVVGQNTDPDSGRGVFGEGSTGVYGSGDQYGVHGYVTGSQDRGVYGQNTYASSGFGVYGEGYYGVYGTGNLYGVYGYNSETTGTTYGGVRGSAAGTDATSAGVLGYSSDSDGFGTAGWNYASGVGVGAWSYSGNLIEAYDGDYPGGELEFYVDQAGWAWANAGHGTFKKVEGKADTYRRFSAIQSPEVWFEDFGTAALAEGQAVVTIDPLFAGMVNLEVGYHVYLTPLSEQALLLFVTDKGPDSFTVKGVTLDGSPAAGAFDYRLVAKSLGYEDKRMEEVVFESRPEVEHKESLGENEHRQPDDGASQDQPHPVPPVLEGGG